MEGQTMVDADSNDRYHQSLPRVVSSAGKCVGKTDEKSIKEAFEVFGGRGGIRTHGTLAGTPVFKTGALNHSATLPSWRHQPLSEPEIKNRL
jgi:hypothetical protein